MARWTLKIAIKQVAESVLIKILHNMFFEYFILKHHSAIDYITSASRLKLEIYHSNFCQSLKMLTF